MTQPTRPMPAAPAVLWLSWPCPPLVNAWWTMPRRNGTPAKRPQTLPLNLCADVGMLSQPTVAARVHWFP